MTRRTGHMLFWLLLAGGLAADLVSKSLVFSFLLRTQGGKFEVWPGVFRLSLAFNTGGPFSVFMGHNWLLVGVTVVALLVILYLYVGSVTRGRLLAVIALALIAAGALGNLVDRVLYQEVRDFLDFHIINYPVFNVADVFITVGAVLLAVELLRRPGAHVKKAAGAS